MAGQSGTLEPLRLLVRLASGHFRTGVSTTPRSVLDDVRRHAVQLQSQCNPKVKKDALSAPFVKSSVISSFLRKPIIIIFVAVVTIFLSPPALTIMNIE